MVDTGGRVTLTWARNRERDLYGYRVFYSLTPDQPGSYARERDWHAPLAVRVSVVKRP